MSDDGDRIVNARSIIAIEITWEETEEGTIE